MISLEKLVHNCDSGYVKQEYEIKIFSTKDVHHN